MKREFEGAQTTADTSEEPLERTGRTDREPVQDERDLAAMQAEILDVLPDAVALVDDLGRMSWSNRTFLREAGLTAEAVQDASILEFAGLAADDTRSHAVLVAIQAGHGIIELSDAAPARGERLRTARVSRLEHPIGRATRVVMFTEIGDPGEMRVARLATEGGARREKELLRGIAESMQDAVIVLEESERVVLANATACRMFGFSPSAVQGRNLADLEIPGSVRGAWLAFLASPHQEQIRSVESACEGRCSALLMQMRRSRSQDGAPLGSVLVVRELLGCASSTRADAAILGGLGHELRTPLMSIQGFSKTLLEEPDLDQKLQEEFVEIIHRESTRLGQLVESLLRLARLDGDGSPLDRAPVNLARQLPTWIDDLASEQELERDAIRVSIEVASVLASVDAQQLREALRQLLRNAATHGASDRGVTVTLTAGETRCRITVRDYGKGVEAEDLERLFEPFVRPTAPESRSRDKGSGLGLSLCRRIVLLHGGSVRAEAGSGGGLQISVEIPLG